MIRKNQDLKKAEFEKIIGKSSGYIGVLKNKAGIPGADVLIKIAENFPSINLHWLLTGEGEMLKSVAKTYPGELEGGDLVEEPVESLQQMRDELRGDIKEMMEEMAANFEALNESMLILLKGNTRTMKMLDKFDEEKIKRTAAILNEYLEEHKNK